MSAIPVLPTDQQQQRCLVVGYRVIMYERSTDRVGGVIDIPAPLVTQALSTVGISNATELGETELTRCSGPCVGKLASVPVERLTIPIPSRNIGERPCACIAMTDRLTLARALEQGGIAREPAENIASTIFDAIHDNVATKTDLRELEQRLDLRFAAIDTRFEQVERQIDRMVTRLGALVVVVAGLLFGALHYFPPK